MMGGVGNQCEESLRKSKKDSSKNLKWRRFRDFYLVSLQYGSNIDLEVSLGEW